MSEGWGVAGIAVSARTTNPLEIEHFRERLPPKVPEASRRRGNLSHSKEKALQNEARICG